MKGLVFDLLRPGTMPLAVLTGLLFMFPLQKRFGKGWLTVICSAGLLLSCMLMTLLRGPSGLLPPPDLQFPGSTGKLELFWGINAELLIGICLLTVLFLLCCQVKWTGAFFGASCAYMAQDLFSMFVSLLRLKLLDTADWPFVATIIVQILITVLFFLFVYQTVVIPVSRDGYYDRDAAVPAVQLLAVMLLNRYIGASLAVHYDLKNSRLLLFFLFYGIIVSVMLLSSLVIGENMARYRREADLERRIREQKEQESALMRSSSDTVNRYAHDIRYLLAALKQEESDRSTFVSESETGSGTKRIIKELEEAVRKLDSSMDTGNAALDVLLSDAWQTCREKEIEWTCMADGSALQMMEPADLFVMLGNALDNAIEAAEQVSDPERRFLSVKIYTREKMSFIRVENYCETMPEIRQGIPVSTKPDPAGHGYGLRSIRSTAARYGGEVSITAADQIFTLQVFLPQK